MFCIHCGEEIPDDSGFCPFCGKRINKSEDRPDMKQYSDTEPIQSDTHISRNGFSDKISDPAIKSAMKSNRKGTTIFAVILILAPVVITLILGVKNDDMSIVGIGAVISVIFLIINLISGAKKKTEKQWDGTVTDKRLETKRKKFTSEGDRDAQSSTIYITQFSTDSGKTKTLEEAAVNHIYYDYLNVGDKVRYYPQFNCYYEKYDKSFDTYAICPVCATKNNITDDTCSRCGVPVIK